jgi:hypothetical protein
MASKIVGVCYHGDAKGNPYPAMQAAEIGWLRMDIPFPFEDRLGGTLTDTYRTAREEMRRAAGYGFKIQGILPQWGHRFFDSQAGENQWHDEFPAWMGTPEDDAYYAKFSQVAEFIARDLGDVPGGYWQIGNELDTFTFRGPYSIAQAVRFAFAGAEGILKARPGDHCGVNPAELSSASRELLRLAYAPGSPLDYAGIDDYFGSWIPGEVSDWIPVIDEVAAITGKPVLIAEWGYPSLGKNLEFDPALVERMYQMSEDERVMALMELGLPLGVNPFCYWKGWANFCGDGHTEQVQAEYITEGLKIFAEHPQVLGSFLYCWRDSDMCYHCGQPKCPSECGWGLVKTDESPKLGLAAFRAAVKKYY